MLQAYCREFYCLENIDWFDMLQAYCREFYCLENIDW